MDKRSVKLSQFHESQIELICEAHHALEIIDDGKKDCNLTVIARPYSRITIITDHREQRVSMQYMISAEQSAQVFHNIQCAAHGEYILQYILAGQEASVNVRGIYRLNNDNILSIKTMQHHKQANSSSIVSLKGTVDGTAQHHYHGIIEIAEQAVQSEAQQESKSMILNARARVTVLPTMQVKTNEVRCSHGGAIGQLDQEHLYYLQSRGMDGHSAKKLLIEAFLK